MSNHEEEITYDVYQTVDQKFVFMPWLYAKSHIAAGTYRKVYSGKMKKSESLESLFARHNWGDRPNAKHMRSMSASDIVVTHSDGTSHAYYVDTVGFIQVDDLLPELVKE